MLAYTVNVPEEFLENIEEEMDPISEIDRHLDVQKFTDILNETLDIHLSERERQVICYLYGLRGYPELRVVDISKKLGLSRGTITYYIKRSFGKFNKIFRSHAEEYSAVS